ncbi:hypothetical protein FHG87_006260 [Trinorchestia longiramus]|nr:hypothetical protein FHG87_006260 [Trinorchestia longiramus]
MKITHNSHSVSDGTEIGKEMSTVYSSSSSSSSSSSNSSNSSNSSSNNENGRLIYPVKKYRTNNGGKQKTIKEKCKLMNDGKKQLKW